MPTPSPSANGAAAATVDTIGIPCCSANRIFVLQLKLFITQVAKRVDSAHALVCVARRPPAPTTARVAGSASTVAAAWSLRLASTMAPRDAPDNPQTHSRPSSTQLEPTLAQKSPQPQSVCSCVSSANKANVQTPRGCTTV
eukprot:3246387-Prymnesium_polylepis.2